MSQKRIFGPWTIAILVVVGAASLFVVIAGDEIEGVDSFGNDSFSRSALGHRAFLDLLSQLDIPVVQSRFNSAGRAGDSLVAFLEPQITGELPSGTRRLKSALGQARNALLVLPKWEGFEHPNKPGHIFGAKMREASDVESVLDVAVRAATLHRPAGRGPRQWEGTHAPPAIRSIQLIRSGQVTPLVFCADGILVGEMTRGRRTLTILSDPDLLNTHGLRNGANAEIAVGLIDRLRGEAGGSVVVVDEVFHGYGRSPSILRAIFEFPLVVATLHVLLLLALLFWTATRRFGTTRAPPPALEPGKEFLIENVASLLRYGRYTERALQRYARLHVSDVARQLHVPRGLDREERQQWLDRAAQARGLHSLTDLARAVDAASGARRVSRERIVSVARRVRRWKEEMVHGPRERS